MNITYNTYKGLFEGIEMEALKQKLTARLGKPTAQLTRQYKTPTRRCTTETKLQEMNSS